MARDPYTVLGVSKSASESEVKSAYRRLAKRYHPDTNADDPKAQERFAEVNAAYEIVGDKDKRKQFDRGEIGADGQQRYQSAGFGTGGEGPFGGFSGFGGGGAAGRNDGRSRTFRFTTTDEGGPSGVDEILREFMGGGGGGGAKRRTGFGSQEAVRGEDLEVIVTVTLEDLASDEKLRVSLPTGRTVDVRLPPGAEPDQQIRLRGLGHESALGGPAGDAILTLRIASHPLFVRELALALREGGFLP
ncbi:MAG: DnaJ domain-containing protein, partial [Pseudomonadota bacterium]